LDIRQEHLSLSIIQEVALLLPGQVPDVPADAVHRQEAFTGILLPDTVDRAQELTAGEA
jgi:hypothetical protein